MHECFIEFNQISILEFYGVNDHKLEMIKKAFPSLKIVARGHKIKFSGQSSFVQDLKEKIELIIHLIEKNQTISYEDFETIINNEPENLNCKLFSETHHKDIILTGNNGKIIKAKTWNQKKMIEAAEKNDIVFAVGPAGTGKTYTAVALAVKFLKFKLVKKIILTRPAVEAGENLGFLPGDLKEKIDPYLKPLYDALEDMLSLEKIQYYLTNKIIEIAPLAYMRGRTLDNAFIILDEAQNANDLQIKMFLTRLGPNAKAIITGDPSQIDLPKNIHSGLEKACKLLKIIEGIEIIKLDETDVVRHKLVKKIILAYQNSNIL
ncbi:MAG: PhoH family protein [Alphaproteobacteria bacterium]|nr:PhoH family protein [Alphaproteobacteria bacterium]